MVGFCRRVSIAKPFCARHACAFAVEGTKTLDRPAPPLVRPLAAADRRPVMLEFPAAAPRFCARHVAGALVSLITACVIDVAVGPACAVAAGSPCTPPIVLLLGHSNPTAVPFAVDSPVYDSTFVPGLY